MTDERTPMVVSGATATVLMATHEVSGRLAEIRAALTGSEPVVAFLSSLTASGVRGLPSFACVGREANGVRLLLRGCTSAIVRGPDGQEFVHDAGSVSTWVETVAAPCAEVELRWDGAAAALVTFGPVSAPDGEAAAVDPGLGLADTALPDHDAVPSTDSGPTPAGDPPVEPLPVGLPTGAPHGSRSLRADAGAELTRPPEPAEPIVHEDEQPANQVPSVPPALADDADEVDLSHLFETRHVGVEAAAVREEVDDEGLNPRESAPATSEVPMPPMPAPTPVHQLPPPTGTPVDAPPPPGLISGVPRPGAPADPNPELGDHDGLTISPAQAAALREGQPAGPPVGSSGAQLQAVACPAGHLNPPQAVECRACQAPIQDHRIRLVHRPSLGHLRFDGGLVADIDRPLLVGRKPTAEGLKPGDEVPGLVALPDPDGMLSRVHLEVRVEGWEVLVVDRDSTNGTVIEIPGQAPVRLRPLEPVLITRGTRITLADAAGCTFETGPR